jgi:hypothetical protein
MCFGVDLRYWQLRERPQRGDRGHPVDAARTYGLDPRLVCGVFVQESHIPMCRRRSNYERDSVGWVNAVGRSVQQA